MFPIRLAPDNDVNEPQMFVFKDIAEYESRGKNVDTEYVKMMSVVTKRRIKKLVFVAPIVPKPELKEQKEIPSDIVGKQVKHKSFGFGKSTAI